jgi:2-polyprenyl-3-methyl-5-hydroxy-6-metoxy-1,4-benzoquinol methylase
MTTALAAKSLRETGGYLACWCGGDWREVFRTRRFGLLRCRVCRGYRIDPPPILRPEQSAEFYTRYYEGEKVQRWLQPADDSGSAGFRKVCEQVPDLCIPGDRVLDYGCGDGHLCADLRAAGWKKVFGIDISSVRVERARERYPEIGFFDSLDTATHVDYGSLDLVVMDSVIEHLPDPTVSLERIRRFLKPSGRILVMTPNMESGSFAFLGKRWTGMLAPHAHIFLFTEESLKQLLRKAGYEPIRGGSFHVNPYRLSQFIRRFASGDVKGALWRSHQEIGGWYGRLTGDGPMLYVLASATLPAE